MREPLIQRGETGCNESPLPSRPPCSLGVVMFELIA
jgi:hypothetical protein